MGIGSQLGEHILQPVIQRAGSELGKDAMYGINCKNRSDDEVYNGLKPLKTQYSIVPLFHYSIVRAKNSGFSKYPILKFSCKNSD